MRTKTMHAYEIFVRLEIVFFVLEVLHKMLHKLAMTYQKTYLAPPQWWLNEDNAQAIQWFLLLSML